ncbi:MAG: sugar transferase, partial [Acidimicrobiales bacterium]
MAAVSATVTVSVAYGDPQVTWPVAFNAVVLGVLILRRTYRFRLSSSVLDEAGSAVIATAIAVVIVVALRAFISVDPDAAVQSLRWGALVALNLAVVRVGSYLWHRRTFLAGHGHKTVIIGAGSVGRQVSRRLLERPELGLLPVGFLDKEPRMASAHNLELPVLGASWDLENLAAAHALDHVVIAFSTAPHHVLVDVVRRSHLLGLRVLMVPRLFEEVPLGNRIEFAGGIPLLRVEPATNSWQMNLKYGIDRVAAAVALVVMAPLLLTIALAVRSSSPGPVFFRQRRVGLDGREFDMLKFRTMVGSAGVGVQSEADAGWVTGIVAGVGPDTDMTQATDRRTPLGRVLRKLSLDELPQFINVLKGEMTLVGPRPERASL